MRRVTVGWCALWPCSGTVEATATWVQARRHLGGSIFVRTLWNSWPDGSTLCIDLQKIKTWNLNNMTTKGCWSRSVMIHRETFCQIKVGGGSNQQTMDSSSKPEPWYFPLGLKQKLQIIDAVHYHSRWLWCVCVCARMQITLYCAKTGRWFIYGPFQWDELFSAFYRACLRVFVKQRFPSPLIQRCRSYCSTSLTRVSMSI